MINVHFWNWAMTIILPWEYLVFQPGRAWTWWGIWHLYAIAQSWEGIGKKTAPARSSVVSQSIDLSPSVFLGHRASYLGHRAWVWQIIASAYPGHRYCSLGDIDLERRWSHRTLTRSSTTSRLVAKVMGDCVKMTWNRQSRMAQLRDIIDVL